VFSELRQDWVNSRRSAPFYGCNGFAVEVWRHHDAVRSVLVLFLERLKRLTNAFEHVPAIRERGRLVEGLIAWRALSHAIESSPRQRRGLALENPTGENSNLIAAFVVVALVIRGWAAR
jgi:hypothetical protein